MICCSWICGITEAELLLEFAHGVAIVHGILRQPILVAGLIDGGVRQERGHLLVAAIAGDVAGHFLRVLEHVVHHLFAGGVELVGVERLLHEYGLDLEVEEAFADLGELQTFRGLAALGFLAVQVILELGLEAIGRDLFAVHLAHDIMMAAFAIAAGAVHHDQTRDDKDPEDDDHPLGLLFHPFQRHCGKLHC
jgi:hypothetical protein